MSYLPRLFLLLAVPLAAAAQPAPPLAPTGPATDTYFGTVVADPYRNLENLQDPAVLAWMKAQSEYARRTLDAIPGRAGLLASMTEYDARRAAVVSHLRITATNRYFYLKERPEDQQPKLYYRDGYAGAEVLLFDPERAEVGKVFAINDFSPSLDGTKVSLVVSEGGAELGMMLILDVKTRQPAPEKLLYARRAAAWLPDNASFTYLPLNSADLQAMEARRNTQCLLHRVGTPASQDRPVFSARHDPELGISPAAYPFLNYHADTRLLLGTIYTVGRYLQVFYAQPAGLASSKVTWQPLFEPAQEVTNMVGDAHYLYFTTSKNAPHQQIRRTPTAHPNVATAELVVPESPTEALNDEQLCLTRDGLYFVRTRNGVEAKLYFLATDSRQAQELPLPHPAGSIRLQAKDAQSPELWVTPVGWTADRQRYRYVAATRQFVSEPLSSEVQYPEFAGLVVEEVLVPAPDGVLVPLSLVYKQGTPRNGTAPVLLEGYGAYGTSLSPFFSPPFLLWAQQGGVFAVAHVRGGGELGEAWHLAGQKATKPTTWKDFIACAEYLVKNRYTAPGHLAIVGGSAGGILIGRALTERPDLFAVAIPEVGIMNAVRMENSPNGPVNVPEFGTMAKEDEARALLEMDAYQHLKPGTRYPATLVTAGFNDPRVTAWQPAKFAARLQASTSSNRPCLFFTNYEAGHGQGDSKQQEFASVADLLAFALWQTGQPAFQPAHLPK